MEALCKAQNLPGRLIPTPRELTADCGGVRPLDARRNAAGLGGRPSSGIRGLAGAAGLNKTVPDAKSGTVFYVYRINSSPRATSSSRPPFSRNNRKYSRPNSSRSRRPPIPDEADPVSAAGTRQGPSRAAEGRRRTARAGFMGSSGGGGEGCDPGPVVSCRADPVPPPL